MLAKLAPWSKKETSAPASSGEQLSLAEIQRREAERDRAERAAQEVVEARAQEEACWREEEERARAAKTINWATMSASGIGAKVKSSAEIHDHIIQLDEEGNSESEEEVEVEQSKKDSGVEYFESEDELREEMRKETCSVEAYSEENLVYLRMVCKEVRDRKRIIAVCLKCNTSGGSDTIINSSATKLTESFLKKTIVSCRHALVSKLIYKHENVVEAEQSFRKCFTIKTNDKEHLSACSDGKTFATVVCRLSRGSKRGKCLSCKGDMCGHTKAWNYEVSNEIFENNDETVDVSEEMEIDSDEIKDYEDSCKKKMGQN